MFDWDDLRYFLAVAQAGSLSQAARRLGSHQPTVGRRIGSLEAALKVCLFERHPRGYVLTPAGQSILDAASAMDAASLEVVRRVLGQDVRLEGTVRISTIEGLGTVWLTPRLPALRAVYPGIDIVVTMEDVTADMARLEADIAIRLFRPQAAELVARKVGATDFGMFAAPSYLAARPPLVRPADIATHDVVTYEESLAHVPESRWLAQFCQGWSPVFRSNSVLALRAAVAGGMGLGLLPLFVVPRDLGLVRVLGDAAIPSRDIWLVVHRDLEQTARVRAVLDFLVDAFTSDAKALEGML